MTGGQKRKRKGRKMLGTRKEKKGRRGERSERDRKITREENMLESNKKVWVGKEVMKN